MPRHPPCALNNLTTTTHTHNKPTPRHTHPPRTRPKPDPEKQACAPRNRDKRCSRPLCSSQTTTSHRRTGTARPRNTTPRAVRHPTGPDRGPASPTPAHRGGVRSLRTQQRAYHPRPARPRSTPGRHPRRTPPGSTGGRHEPAAELVSVPPSSTTPHARPAPVAGHRIGDVGAALDHRTPCGGTAASAP